MEMFNYKFTEGGYFADQANIMRWLLNGGVVAKWKGNSVEKIYFFDEGNLHEMSYYKDSQKVDKTSKGLSREDFHYPTHFRPRIEPVRLNNVGVEVKADRDYPNKTIVTLHLGEIHEQEMKSLKELQVIGGAITLWR